MPADCISFRETGFFSGLICDYLDEKKELKKFYNRFPKIENFKEQIEEKKQSFPEKNREALFNALSGQYKNIEASETVSGNIQLLKNQNTFTVITGHQLNLFTGPLYFLYKIISAINLTHQLKNKYRDYHFVPVYWMATEDHDFEEINHFNFHGKKFSWNKDVAGAVGELSTQGLEEVFKLFELELGNGINAEELKKLFKEAYLNHENLTDATRYMVNKLFGEHGLVIVDGNDKLLKKIFVPYIVDELDNKTSYHNVSNTIKELNNLKEENYAIQVNPREINLFYLKQGLRERIIEVEADVYTVNETDIKWNKQELLDEVKNFPERFSPNVMMRPLYQEVILPNLCYIGGGGELAYWFELKEYFNKVNITFPILLLRNSALIISRKQDEKLKKLNISYSRLFLKQDEFINRKVREISNIDIDFTPQKLHLNNQFEALYKLAKQTDKSFIGAVQAQEKKQIKGLENLEKRLLKAQKRKLGDEVSRMSEIKNELFPNESLQERYNNFSEVYLEYGNNLISELIKSLTPLNNCFTILVI
ncbi:bacillithiol biosynthesis cysteine-adding enzyme BshC [Abyssalbus ytuae]|uniref:Putative cysteine ligase BshC n=1 Tax=Abyssalbus ytuae TaxID=2926907 RepID=A0A9E6ZNJ7_9FLAO|nr:bacillithiol biosynthesis cysteine-adding enzyme BshC [Abyssalbus ytuae]UOB17989.1 bacillithiol biosynthesis cysteine-adding enzyme BshC [Abyssalbus ytuae]